jgi:[acyl-carrier-protein] S-malonyltransferase
MRRENVAIVFPGQGSQYVGMGKDLYDNFQTAKLVFQEVDDAIGQKLSDLIFYGDKNLLNLTENAQPAIMACSIAAYRVLAEINRATSMVQLCSASAGHSLGEYSALCAAGALSLTDTARLLKKRGLAMQDAVPIGTGGMSALLGIDIDTASQIAIEAEKYGTCEVANDNCHGQIVISGHVKALEYAESIARQYGCKKAIRLSVSAPFHCALMHPAAKIMEQELLNTNFRSPAVPIVSNYTARPNISTVQIPQLLTGQISNVVRWTESITLISARYNIKHFIECGPGKVLSGLISRILIQTDCKQASSKEDLENIENIV